MAAYPSVFNALTVFPSRSLFCWILDLRTVCDFCKTIILHGRCGPCEHRHYHNRKSRARGPWLSIVLLPLFSFMRKEPRHRSAFVTWDWEKVALNVFSSLFYILSRTHTFFFLSDFSRFFFWLLENRLKKKKKLIHVPPKSLFSWVAKILWR